MNRKPLLFLVILVLVFGTTAFYPATSATVQDDPYIGRTITGTAYFIGGRRPGRSLPFRLIINRFSTPDEINQLNTALQSGEDDLLRTLSRMDVGRIEVGTGVGVPVNAIIRTDDGEGRTKLKVLYERELRFAELRYGARRADYRFGYAELNVGRGENEGMLIPAARVRLRGGNTWEVEDFGTFPARLMGLQVRGGGRRSVG